MGQDKEKARRERRCEMLKGDIRPVYTMRTSASYLYIHKLYAVSYLSVHILYRESYVYHTVNHTYIAP